MAEAESEVSTPVGNTYEIVRDRAALKRASEAITFNNPQVDVIQLAADLVKNMVDTNGLGLSAPQIGQSYQMFCMRTAPKAQVIINPSITWVSEETEVQEEGCLSFPGLIIKVRRPVAIRAQHWWPNGEFKTVAHNGITARVYQHEFDHVNGIVFQDRASLFHLQQAERQKARRERNGR